MRVLLSAFLAAVLSCALGSPAAAQEKRDLTKEIDDLRLEVQQLKKQVEGNSENRLRFSRNEEEEPFPVKVSGEIRLREEYWNHLYGPAAPGGEDTFDYAHMRTRLRFDVDVERNLSAVVELQDVRTLGSEGATAADTAGVDIKRAGFLVRDLFSEPITIEAGRFVMAYGDERIIGAFEWADQGRTYDGARLHFGRDRWFIDFFGVRVNDLNNSSENDKDLIGVYGGDGALCTCLGVEGYALVYRQERTLAVDQRRFVTVGTRLFGNRSGFDYTGEMAFQTGDIGSDDLYAYAFAVKGGFTAEDCPMKPRLGVELAYASGDSKPNDGDNEQFQHMFPTNHMHYGYADLVGWSNIWDHMAGISIHPADEVTVACNYHHLRLDDTDGGWINAGGNTVRSGAAQSRHLGEEVDLTVKWKAMKALALLGGYSRFIPGGYVEDTGDSRALDFLYLQARVVF